MAYDKGRLSAKQVEAATTPGHVADGKGLYLQVSKWGAKSWVFKFTLGGRTRGMGLGPIDELSLKKAREEVERLRVMVREGRDPIEERAEQRRTLKVKYDESSAIMLFKDAIAKAHARKEGEFSNEKHRKDWRSSLDKHEISRLLYNRLSEHVAKDVAEIRKLANSDAEAARERAFAVVAANPDKAAMYAETRAIFREMAATGDPAWPAEATRLVKSDRNIAAALHAAPAFNSGLSDERHRDLVMTAVVEHAPDDAAAIVKAGEISKEADKIEQGMSKLRQAAYDTAMSNKARATYVDADAPFAVPPAEAVE